MHSIFSTSTSNESVKRLISAFRRATISDLWDILSVFILNSKWCCNEHTEWLLWSRSHHTFIDWCSIHSYINIYIYIYTYLWPDITIRNYMNTELILCWKVDESNLPSTGVAFVEQGNVPFSELKEEFFWAEIERNWKNEDKILIERDLFFLSFIVLIHALAFILSTIM